MEALIPIVIPVLRKSNRCYRCQNQHRCHPLFHLYSVRRLNRQGVVNESFIR
jgi:hypothetical protein